MYLYVSIQSDHVPGMKRLKPIGGGLDLGLCLENRADHRSVFLACTKVRPFSSVQLQYSEESLGLLVSGPLV
jgi:hypothetical protein